MDDDTIQEHPLPDEAGYYFMVYNLKTPSSWYSPWCSRWFGKMFVYCLDGSYPSFSL
jgi:hypothetical protein